MTVSIIGSGLAGTAAAHGLSKLERDSVIYEAHDYTGGHTHSDVVDGFTFDEGPHVSFTKDERVRDIFASGAGEIEELTAHITNYFEGHWITHPAQVHLFGLDPDMVTSCITDMVAAQQNPPEIKTYADWLVAQYGETFAKTFPFKYTRKYWTVEAQQLGVDWVGGRMYPPSISEVVRGALAAENPGQFHYFKNYRYPASGGYESFMNELRKGANNVQTNKEVVEIDVSAKTLRFADGSTAPFEQLINSMPLDQLVPRITGRDVPSEVLDAAKALLCTSVVLVDIAVDRPDIFDNDWFYVYDEDISMSRVHLPSRLAPGNAPAGTSSLQGEVYFSREKQLETPAEQLPERCIDEFIKMGIIRNRDEVRFSRQRTLEYANIVFDHQRQPALDLILPFIEDCGILLAGRFGEWGYHWTDDATNAGWKAAARVGGVTVEEMLD